MPVPTPAMGVMLGRDEHAHQIVQRLVSRGACELSVVSTVGNEQLVVLKRLPARLATDPVHVERFRAEARIAALLDHPRIVRVHEVVESDRDDYYTMEYVRGADLRQLLDVLALQRRTLPLDCAVIIAIEVCNALDYAHDLVDARGARTGVVHRELAPSKILIGDDGDIKVTGFGAPPSARGRALRTRNDTRGYLCPERFMGEPLDGRSDIFALGVMLYELTSGMRPFADASDHQIMSRMVGGNMPRPSEARRGYPRELEAILMRALERDRERRYQTAGEMQRELETFLWSKWPTASNAALARVVQAAFPAHGRRSAASDLAHGSGELERIDFGRDVAERSEASQPMLWLGPVPLAKPYRRMDAGTAPSPADLAQAVADIEAPLDDAPIELARPVRAETESARITARVIDLPLRADPSIVERDVVDEVIDLIPTVARPSAEVRAHLAAMAPRPRREPTALDFDIDVEGEQAGVAVHAIDTQAPPARASASRMPLRPSEASLRPSDPRLSAWGVRPPSSDPHPGIALALPRGRRWLVVAAGAAVALVVLSFWAIWRNVHEQPPLPPVITAQPAPPADVIIKNARPAAIAVPALAPPAAGTASAAGLAAKAIARPRPLRPVAAAKKPAAVAVAVSIEEPAPAIEPEAAPPPAEPEPTPAPRPRIKPPHAGLFPPTDPPPPPAPPALAAFDAVPSLASLTVDGALPDAVARRAVEAALGALRACYRTAAKAGGHAPALDLQIGFEVGPARAATKVRAIGGGQLAALTRCAANATARIRTAQAPAAGTARVLATIRFRR